MENNKKSSSFEQQNAEDIIAEAGQKGKVTRDILKMLLLDKLEQKTHKKFFIVCDEKLYRQLNGDSVIAQSIHQFGIELKKIDIDNDLMNMLMSAQEMQKMINA